MKTNRSQKTKALLAAVACLAGLAQAADEPTLKVGDKAPQLQTGKWIQGEPVKEFQKDKAYIVEFWATWCGPCRVSIPHLNDIYTKYKDKGLVVIGQDCWERDDNLVAPFVEKMGEKMTYRVALDNKESNEKGKMAETWMAAAGQNGIPSAFLVDTKGSIAWIGHPMSLEEQVIDDVLAGKFDTKKAAAQYEQDQKNEIKMRTAWMEIMKPLQQKDWDTAMAKLDDYEKLLPEKERARADMMRFNILIAKKDYPAAYKLAEKFSDAHKEDAELQNELAWRIATDNAIEERNLKLAETIATRANDAAKDAQKPGVLDTLARVKFMLGKKKDAIALQEKAIALSQGEEKENLQKTLDGYKKGELAKE